MVSKVASAGFGPVINSDRVSRAEQIARAILERIERRELKVGDKLPPESALAQHFGVSRAAVREAIARLRAEGRVETIQGSGAYVRDPAMLSDGLDATTRHSVKSLLDLIAVRRVMEAEIAELAARSRTPDQLAAIEAAWDRLCAAEEANEDGIAEDTAFHAAIAAASGNTYWLKLTEVLSRNVAIGIGVTRVNEARRKDFSAEVKSEHHALLEALRAGDPLAARAAAIRHLDRAADRIRSAEEEFWQSNGAAVRNLA
ncbi:FadR family transcriptional regulator [Novosphingobium sp. YJ-S2-02]|uniref:FadR family transcriptional regulator n=1 Tax=Novosphingobium aureum TaxID=2792964 RepID=A0A931MLY6_9SPHN|nr:FadR/GntR family transcriptional regulator [Novosphingobium aureum]MBH0113860.1 FadR family transcriptional regulator [Novosphingobium aureum]